MGAISIRGVDDELTRRLKEEAETAHKSLNQLVIDIMEQHVGLGEKSSLPINIMIWMSCSGSGAKMNLQLFKGKWILKGKSMKNFGNE